MISPSLQPGARGEWTWVFVWQNVPGTRSNHMWNDTQTWKWFFWRKTFMALDPYKHRDGNGVSCRATWKSTSQWAGREVRGTRECKLCSGFHRRESMRRSRWSSHWLALSFLWAAGYRDCCQWPGTWFSAILKQRNKSSDRSELHEEAGWQQRTQLVSLHEKDAF